ncbi:uncharacterized protein METZ01_LOCUS459221, partial [marine metagenome]
GQVRMITDNGNEIPVNEAFIQALNEETGITFDAVTNDNGHFEMGVMPYMQYFVSCTLPDPSGTTQVQEVFVEISPVELTFVFGDEPPPSGITVDYQSDWNLIGLPLEVLNPSYTTIFPESIEGTLYSFSGGYNPVTELINGKGYWLRFNEAGSTTISGIPINELTLSLSEDWNLISGISTPLNISEIQDPNGIIIAGTIYGFASSGYSNAEILEPGKGYWIRANSSGYISFISNPEPLPEECYIVPEVGPC